MSMPNESFVSVIRGSLSVLAALYTGMWFTDQIPGIGMYIPMACMLMHSQLSVIRFGGIGVMAPTVGDGIMAGDGIVLTIPGDITRVLGADGMATTGVVGMAVATGDTITIGMMVLAGAGAVEAEDLPMDVVC